jgi:hypothetical protein
MTGTTIGSKISFMLRVKKLQELFYFITHRQNAQELSDIEDELTKIGQVLKYPVHLEEIIEDAIIESSAFDRSSKNYIKYVALLCSMWKCNEDLERRFSANFSSFQHYWLS